VTIEPKPQSRPPIWIGGGSQLADPNSPESGRFAEAVKARILRTEGWIPRPTCPPDEIGRDWTELQGYLSANGRDPTTLTVAHENFMHLVRTNDPAAAREEQHRAFARVMSDVRGRTYLEKVYLFGTPDEIVNSLQARIDAGVQRFMLHTLTPDVRQLEHWLTEVVAHVRFPPVNSLASRPA